MVCGALILTLAMGVRHTGGLFLQPMTLDQGWSRELFSFSIALQNLLWGVFQPFAGAFADAQPPAQAGGNPWAPWLEAWQQALPAAFSDYLGAISPAAPRGRK